MRFRYVVGDVRDGNATLPLYVDVLSGADYTTATRIDTDSLRRATNDGWQTAILDIQRFQGQSIKLRFRNYGDWIATSRVENVSLSVDTPAWTPSDARMVQIVNDGNNDVGRHLLLLGASTASSEAFNVPTTAQSVRFRYMVGDLRDGNGTLPFYVDVLSGADYTTATRIDADSLRRVTNDGWQTAILDIQRFQDRNIKVRFRNYGDWIATTRVDSITLNVETPSWTPSDTRVVQSSTDAFPSTPGRTTPDNAAFEPNTTSLSACPANCGFSQGRQVLDVALSPASYVLNGAQTASTAAFTMPSTAHSIRFRYLVGDVRSTTSSLPLYVDVLSGDEYAVATRIDADSVRGTTDDGWKQATLDLQRFQGQRIKIRFRNYGDWIATSRIDSLSLNIETPAWTPSDGRLVQIANDATAGQHLLLQGATSTVSSAFTVPAATQSLHFQYLVGDVRSATGSLPFYVDVLSGPNYTVATRIDRDSLRGATNDGWKDATLDLQRFRGQSVKLRFRNYGDWIAVSRVDALSLNIDTPSWTPSDARVVQIASGANAPDGTHLLLQGANTATSDAFFVSTDTQTVDFRYLVGDVRSATGSLPFYVDVLSGPDFATVTRIDRDTLRGTINDGWKSASLDLTGFRGRAVKLRFRNYGDWIAISRIDSISLSRGTTGSSAGNDPNPGGAYLTLQGASTTTSTPFRVPHDVQNVQFRYFVGDVRDGNGSLPFYVDVASGPDYSILTRIDGDQLRGTRNDGWKLATLNLQRFQGRVIKLRFRNYGDWIATSSIDAITFTTGASGDAAAHDPNPGCRYLQLDGGQAATSSAFTVPSTLTTLNFDYQVGDVRDGNGSLPLYVDVLSGANYATTNRIDGDTLRGALNDGWKRGALNIAAFQGQSIKVRFRNYGDWIARSKIDTIGDGVTGTCSSDGRLETSVDSPSTIPSGTVGTFQIQYKNTSNVDMDVPLFQVISRGGAPIALSEERLERGATSLHVLLQGSDGQMDKLPAGVSGSILVYTKATAVLDFALTPVPLNAPIPWETLKPDYMPTGINPIQFDAYWNAVRAQLGETGHELRANLLIGQETLSSVAGTRISPMAVYDLVDMQAQTAATFGEQATSLVELLHDNATMSVVPPDESSCPPRVSNNPGSVHLTPVKIDDRDPSGTLVRPTGELPQAGVMTYVIVHGWNNGGGKNIDGDVDDWDTTVPPGRAADYYGPMDWMHLMASGIKAKEPDANVIFVDWAEGARTGVNLLRAATNTHWTGYKIKQQLEAWRLTDASKIRFIGHSLGAHTSSFASDYMDCDTSFTSKVKQITGLDPATSFFGNLREDILGIDLVGTDPRMTDTRSCPAKDDLVEVLCKKGFGGYLESSDASFVDVYNTSQLGGGGDGHQEIQVNGAAFAEPQPGCSFWDLGGCSHSYAYWLYTATIRCPNYHLLSTRGWVIGWPIPIRTEPLQQSSFPESTYQDLNICNVPATEGGPSNTSGSIVRKTLNRNVVGPRLPNEITGISSAAAGTSPGVLIGTWTNNTFFSWPNPSQDSLSGGWGGISPVDSGWSTGHPYLKWQVGN